MQLPESFKLIKQKEISELKSTLYEIEHTPTGATILHLANEDSENLFCLSFQTLPQSSNGAPHILEHVALCGSKKFPVKDPFFYMNRRSLNTYMNALTGSDFTCYPAASQVEKDFYNLLDVYLDAVFNPLLTKESFLQEGHRFDFEESKLVYKGIVFNEMKGSMSSPETRLWHHLNEKLLPDTPYAFNSGGDPKDIPSLTYQELLEFHKRFYHPSRCLFFFYGDLPLAKHLAFIDKNILSKSDALAPLPPIEKQKRFTKPQSFEMTYPCQDADLKKKSLIGFGWLTMGIQDQEEILALSLLESVLMDTDASPLKQALLRSGLCIDAHGMMDGEMSEIPYVIICRGCEAEEAEKLEKILFDALKEIAEKGLDDSLIQGALHQMEFHRLEIEHSHAPFGLTLFFRSALLKQHGANPEIGLLTYSLCEKLAEKVKNPQYLPNLMRKYLIDNPHFVRTALKPDPEMEAREQQDEEERLAEIEKSLTEQAKEKIVSEAKKLNELQEKIEKQSGNCLPKIALNEVPFTVKHFPLTEEKMGELTIVHHECFTNHIIYAHLLFDLPDLSPEELPYLTLLTNLLPELGCANRNYDENLAYLQTHVGGFGIGAALNAQFGLENQERPSFALRGKALHRNTDKLFKILREYAIAPRFDEKERIKELILQFHSSLQSKMSRNPMGFATLTALAGYTKYAAIKESLYGLKYFQFIERLAHNIDGEIDLLIERLIHLKQKVFHLSSPTLILSCSREGLEIIKEEHAFGLAELPAKPFTPWTGAMTPTTPLSQARTTSSPVAFTAYGLKTVSGKDPAMPALTLCTNLMDNITLHKRIREQGGAYGSGSHYNPTTGALYFYGFRDPHLNSTCAAFKEAVQSLAAGKFDEDDLEEAKLQIIQVLDSPTSPGARAAAEFFALRENRTLEEREAYRRNMLAVTKKEIVAVAEKHLLPLIDKGTLVTYAGKELLKREKSELPQLKLND